MMLWELWSCCCILLLTKSYIAFGFTALHQVSPFITFTKQQHRSPLLAWQEKQPWWQKQYTRKSSQRMATLMPEEKLKEESPAYVFGHPLDQATKDANHKMVQYLKKFLFDQIFSGDGISRYYARFYALETIARMPYFAYVSVLHLFETLGWWRRADYLKVHFSESWNELHHLLIMEELGGADRWIDRFVAQHIAFAYYWMVVVCYMSNPSFAYNLNQNVEEEAYETYNQFLQDHREYLLQQPAPDIAKKYYTGTDLYLFDEMHFNQDTLSSQSSSGGDIINDNGEPRRRPKIENLFDVFSAIRDDEMEHAKTMLFMQALDEKNEKPQTSSSLVR